MEKKPYHHLPDGTFRNPEGSPKRDQMLNGHTKFLMLRRKKIKIDFPEDHIVPRNEVLKIFKKTKIVIISLDWPCYFSY